MTQWLRQWILGLAGAAALCAAALALTPPGRVQRVQKLVCSTVMLLALISPLYSLDTGALARAMARSRETELALSQQAEQAAQRLRRSIIEEECAAYILDKAAETGITLDAASVTARWDEDGFWYPWEARLDGADGSKKQLAPVIEAQLGIPEARQYWSCDEDT